MTTNRIILPRGYDGTALSGIPSNPPNVTSSRFPLPEGQGNQPVARHWPISKAEDQRITVTTHDGRSNSEFTIMYNLILQVWRDGRNYHNEIREGDPLFVITGLVESEKQALPVLNLRHVNQWLAEHFEQGMSLFEKTVTPKAGTGTAVPAIVDANLLSKECFKLMNRIPAHHWAYLPELSTARRDPKLFGAIHLLDYLHESIMREHFNFFGFARGQVPENLHVKTIAVSRSGRVDDVPNYWGPHVLNEMHLYWIFKRQYDKVKDAWGPLGFWPYASYDHPSAGDKFYIDYTGHHATGMALYVGKALRYVEKFDMDADYLSQLIGAKPLQRQQIASNGAPGVLRIKMKGLPCRKLPWSAS